MITNINVGEVVRFNNGNYYIMTRKDENFIFAKRVEYNCKIDNEELALFTIKRLEKESQDVVEIVDMNEIVRRYLELA